MSRDIKFRAWDNETEQYFKVLAIDFERKIVSCRFFKWEYGPSNPINLDDLTLEQYTDLKDASGDEIYENDLVSLDPDDPPYQVIFDEGKFEISNDYLRLVYDLSEEHMDCEIVGNVHMNPELLEEDK